MKPMAENPQMTKIDGGSTDGGDQDFGNFHGSYDKLIIMESGSEAIKALILTLTPSSPITTLADLADGVILSDILLLVDGVSLEKQKINRQIDTWTVGLNNIKVIEKTITAHYEEVLHRDYPFGEWEPIEVSKNKSEDHILKLFSLILGIMAQASNKEFFIQRILSLCTDHQAFLANIIKSTMADSASVESHKQHKLLEQINTLEIQNEYLRTELSKSLQNSNKFVFEIKQLEDKLEVLNLASQSQKTLEEELPVEPSYTEERNQEKILIQSLKDKLIKLSLEHQKQIIKYKEQMGIMESKVNSISELEALADMYKENYEEALEHLSKVNIWEKEKQQMAITLTENTHTIAEKDQQISQLNEKCSRVEQELLDFQMQYERLKIRYQDLEEQVKKTLKIEQKDRPKFERHTLTELCPQIKQDSAQFKLFEATQQIERRNRKIKNLQREIVKLKARADKVHQLQKQKTKLQNIIIDCNETKAEEIEILINCLYELRLKYGHVVEQFSEPVVRQRTLMRSNTQFVG